MILIGQFDSPFVRRVGVAARLYGLTFEHRPWSAFGDAGKLSEINPLTRVPTLVADDGEALIDSAAILDHFDESVGEARALIARRGPARRAALRRIALACGAGDAAVSLFYELRMHAAPAGDFVARRRGQAARGFAVLERDKAAAATPFWFGDSPGHDDIAAACVWRFAQEALPGLIDPIRHPALAALSARSEALPAFAACEQAFVPPA